MKKKVKIAIGEQRTQALYSAIHDPIMDLRIEFLQEKHGFIGTAESKKVDKVLRDLVDTIWRKQAEALGIEKP